MSEDVIMSRVVLDISMSVDWLIAQPDDLGPIDELFFWRDGTRRDLRDLVRYGRGRQGVHRHGGGGDHRPADLRLDQRLGRNHPMRVLCGPMTC
jgi:hypothetical protein